VGSLQEQERTRRRDIIIQAGWLRRLLYFITASKLRSVISLIVSTAVAVTMVAVSIWLVQFSLDRYHSLIAESNDIGYGLFIYLFAVLGMFPALLIGSIITACVMMSISIIKLLLVRPRPLNVYDDILDGENAKNLTHRLHESITLDDSWFANTLLDINHPDESKGVVAITLPEYDTEVAGREARWARALIGGRTYTILCVETGSILPSVVINTRLVGVDILPNRFDNTTEVSFEGDAHAYYSIYATETMRKSVHTLIDPAALWSLVTRLDMCDVEFRGSKMLFLWEDGTSLPEDLLLQRSARVAPFVSKIVESHRITDTLTSDILEPLRPASSVSDMAFVFVAAPVFSLLTMVIYMISGGAAQMDSNPVMIVLFTLLIGLTFMLLPWMCVMLVLVVTMQLARMLLRGAASMRSVSRSRRYELYYRGRQ